MKGITYFDLSHGFSINEGQVPNICIDWKIPMFYLRTKKYRFCSGRVDKKHKCFGKAKDL